MTKSRGIRAPKGTRETWVKENQGRYRCQCGCGREIPLRPAHYGKEPPRLLQGHGARKYQPQPALPCACGCGQIARPGRRYITGHNSRGRHLSEETRHKIAASQIGARNTMAGRLGASNPSWKGGIQRTGEGYILEYRPDHPFARKRYVMQHRLIAEAALRESDPTSEFLVEIEGELYISPKADVHHDNETKGDYRRGTLIIMWKGDHTRHHLPALMSARHRSSVTATNLTPSESKIVDYLRSVPADYAGSIAGSIGMSRGGARYALERLESVGILTGVKHDERNTGGRIRVYYSLTEGAC